MFGVETSVTVGNVKYFRLTVKLSAFAVEIEVVRGITATNAPITTGNRRISRYFRHRVVWKPGRP